MPRFLILLGIVPFILTGCGSGDSDPSTTGSKVTSSTFATTMTSAGGAVTTTGGPTTLAPVPTTPPVTLAPVPTSPPSPPTPPPPPSPLTTFPAEVAVQAKNIALSWAWHAANDRWKVDNPVKDQENAKKAVKEMKKAAKGVLSDASIDEYSSMAAAAAWMCANERAYGEDNPDRNVNKKQMQEHADNMISIGEMKEDLVNQLMSMSQSAGWFTANSRDGNDDAKADEARFNSQADDIGGEAILKSLEFSTDMAKIMSAKPMAVGKQRLNNVNSGAPQSMSWTFSYSKGSTKSWSTSFGFKVGVSATVGCDFLVASGETTVSFESSFDQTWSGETSEGTQVDQTFQLSAPAHCLYEAEAIVQQATMTVPYKMVMAIGESEWTVYGVWDGTAVSSSTYTTNDITPADKKDQCAAAMISTLAV